MGFSLVFSQHNEVSSALYRRRQLVILGARSMRPPLTPDGVRARHGRRAWSPATSERQPHEAGASSASALNERLPPPLEAARSLSIVPWARRPTDWRLFGLAATSFALLMLLEGLSAPQLATRTVLGLVWQVRRLVNSRLHVVVCKTENTNERINWSHRFFRACRRSSSWAAA